MYGFSKKYHPNNCGVRPWNEVEHSFNQWFGEQHKTNIAELVRHIQMKGLNTRLFGSTSMNKLLISICNPIEWDRETLHITFDTDKSEWDFIYYSLPFRAPEFVRTYPADIGIDKFDNFIKMIGW